MLDKEVMNVIDQMYDSGWNKPSTQPVNKLLSVIKLPTSQQNLIRKIYFFPHIFKWFEKHRSTLTCEYLQPDLCQCCERGLVQDTDAAHLLHFCRVHSLAPNRLENVADRCRFLESPLEKICAKRSIWDLGSEDRSAVLNYFLFSAAWQPCNKRILSRLNHSTDRFGWIFLADTLQNISVGTTLQNHSN